MVDRTVSVRLRLDPGGYIGQANASAAATGNVANQAQKMSRAMESATLAARRMGVSAREAATKAAVAQRMAAEAAEKLARGEISAAEAARLGARAQQMLERAEIAQAAASLAAGRAADQQADQLREQARAAAAATAASRLHGQSLNTGARSAALMRSELVSLIALATAVAPAAIAAGVGIGSMAVLAVPSIVKVVKAQQDLAGEWDGLSETQRVAAISTSMLAHQYQQLAASVEPEVLSGYNAALGATRTLMPELVPLTRSVSAELVQLAQRADVAFRSPAAREFFTFLEREAGPATAAFGDVAFSTAHLAGSLTTALMPLAGSTLRVASGMAELAADVTSAAPGLAEFATFSLMLRAPINAVRDRLDGAGGRFKAYAAASRGASLSTKALNLVTAAGPGLYMAAGLAVAFLAYKMATAKSDTDRLVASLRIAHGAVGNNAEGYRTLTQELQTRYSAAVRRSTTQTQQTGYAYKAVSREAQDLANNYAIYRRQQLNVAAGERYLANQFGVTRTQANMLATAAGVDLSVGINNSSEAALAAQQKIKNYAMAVEAARDPSAVISQSWDAAANSALNLKDRTTALTAALDAFFNPSIAMYQANTQLASAFNQTAAAIARAKGNLTNHSEASRAAKESFAQLLTQTSATAQAVYNYTARTRGAAAATQASRAAVQAKIPLLLALAGNNAQARNQVLALAKSFQIETGTLEVTRGAFMRTAAAMGIGKARAEALWRAWKKIPKDVSTTAHARTAAALAAARRLQARLNAIPRNIDMTARMNISDAINRIETLRRYANVRSRPGGPGGHLAEGAVVHYFQSGSEQHVAQVAPAGAWRVWAEPETGGEAYIPLAASKRHRSTAILGAVAEEFGMQLTPMGLGGIIAHANGDGETLSLSDILSSFRDQTKPATKADVTSASTARRRAVDQLKDAEAALRRARSSHDADRIASAERRLRREREDLAAATSKLTSVQARYNISKQRPTTQLGGALAASIRGNAAFLKNLTALADRGYGAFAQQLLAMGGAEAQKLAADAVKLSDAKLKGLTGQVATAQAQQTALQNLPATLAVRSAVRGGATSFRAILRSSDLPTDQLAAAIKAMAEDLSKTAGGRRLLDDVRAMGYAGGGLIGGAGGPREDANLIRASRGEFMVNAASAARHRPLLEAINSGRVGDALLRHLARVSALVRGGDGAAAGGRGGAHVEQTFVIQSQNPAVVARESARETAWMLGGAA